MREKNIDDFCAELASKAPVPGGGAAAALTGAFAASLASMVSELTRGKKKYAEYEEDVVRIGEKARKLSVRLLELASEDAGCFKVVSDAYAVRAVSDEEKVSKAAMLEQALKGACVPPTEMLEKLSEAAELFVSLSDKGSKLLISDTGAGAALCAGAARASVLAVCANTRLMTDRGEASLMEERAFKLLSDIKEKTDLAYSKALKYLT